MSYGLKIVASMLVFVALLVTTSFWLGSIWIPLGAIPFAAYFYIALRWNLRRCVCSHLQWSHNPYLGWCYRCTKDTHLWGRDNEGNLHPLFCTGFRTAAQEAEELLA